MAALLSPTVAAAKPRLGATASALVGVTDNSTALPERDRAATSDVFTGARLSGGLAWLSPRHRLFLAYDVAVNLFFAREDRTSLLQVLTLGDSVRLSPTADMRLAGRAEHGLMSDLSALFTSGGAATVGTPAPQGSAQPSGAFTIFRAGGDESLRWQLLPGLLLEQELRGFFFAPDEDDLRLQKSVAGSFATALTRGFRRHAVGGRLQADVLRAFESDGPLAPPARWLTAAQAMAIWDVSLTTLWHLRLEAGAFTVWFPDEDSHDTEPGGLLSVRHVRPDFSYFALIASRNARPNTLLGDIFITDRVQLQLGTPIGTDWLIQAEASAGREQSALEDINGELEYSVLIATLSVVYRLTDLVALSAHYSFRKQETDSVDPALADLFPSFTRNLVYVSVAVAFPGARAHRELEPGLP